MVSTHTRELPLPPKSPIPKNWSREGYTTRTKGLSDPHQVAPLGEAQGHPGLKPQSQLTTAGATLAQPSRFSPVPKTPAPPASVPLGRQAQLAQGSVPQTGWHRTPGKAEIVYCPTPCHALYTHR